MENTIKEELISFLNNNYDKVHNYVCGDDIEFTWVEHFENEERAWNFSVSFSNTWDFIYLDVEETPHGILFLSTFLDMLLSDNIVEYMVKHGIHGAW